MNEKYELKYEPSVAPVYVHKGNITFNAYETYKEQALAIADFIYGVTEVTEDNIKESKKVLAEARKVVTNLENERKRLKKEWNEPFTKFEQQIKEIVTIIDDADKEIRAQVRDLEEKERQAKKEKLFEMFTDKAQWMIMHDALGDELFDRWLTPYYLNKSVSMKQCEEAMAEWLREKEEGFDVLFETEDDDLRAEYLTAYCKTLDLQTTLKTVQADRKVKEQVSSINTGTVTEEKGIFVVTGKANIKLVEMLLDENGIKYTFRKGE